MKKRRILAMALAVAMLSSSISFNVYADDTAAADQEAVVTDEVASPAANETSASGSNGETPAEENGELSAFARENWIGGLYTNVDNSGEWKASVFGSAGGEDKVTGTNIYTVDGEQIPYFVAQEDGTDENKKVNLRMGVINPDGTSDAEQVGKLSTDVDGLVYYYTELDPSDNFELSADIKINRLGTEVKDFKQAAFGAMVRDFVIPMESAEFYEEYANKLAAAESLPLRQRAAALAEAAAMLEGKYDANVGTNFAAVGALYMNDISTAVRAFYRQDAVLSTASNDPKTAYQGNDLPVAGDKVHVTITKQGNLYKTQYGDSDPVVLDKVTLGDNGKLYAGFFAVRSCDVTVSNIKLEKTKEVSDIKITSLPDKVDYIVGSAADTIDTTGLTAEVTYSDGSKETVGADKLVCTNPDLTTVENGKVVTVNYGGKTDTFTVNVDFNRVVDMTLEYAPVIVDYITGRKFTSNGLQIRATYKSGVSEVLKANNYTLKLDNTTELTDANFYFTNDMVGTHTVRADFKETATTLADGHYVEFNINVTPASFDSISVRSLPEKGTESLPFDLNEDKDLDGLIINGNYTVDGQTVRKALDENEYTVTGLDVVDGKEVFASEGWRTLTVTFNADPSKTCTFDVLVRAKTPVRAYIQNYPRLTYFVGEEFDATGLDVYVRYSNATFRQLDKSEYSVDTSSFDSSTAGASTSVKVVAVMGDVTNEITLPIKIRDNTEKIWKATLMGASSLGVSEKDPSSNITVYDENGDQSLYLTGDKGYVLDEQPVGIMQNGKMTNVSKVNVTSWDGAGKYATDHDGIAYYYTRVNAKDNFEVSADVTVNRYIRDPANAADAKLIADKKAKMQEIYNKQSYVDEATGEIKQVTDLMALDMVRSGQEAFGIMARDVIPMFLPVEKGGNDNSITTDFNAAEKDEYGEPISIFEAYKMQEAGKIEAGITNEDVNIISFSSNVVVAGGATQSTFPTDTTTSSFKEKEVQNRITLSYRSGVRSIDGAGSNAKGGFKTSTSRLPVAGDKYNITLKKINYGYSLTTTDLTVDEEGNPSETYGETQTVYCFEAREGLENLLVRQDSENVYVGFFACRFADIDVENITLKETDAANDPIIRDDTEDIYSPKISVDSALYTSQQDYQLILKASNPSGGLVTIKQNGNIIREDSAVAKKGTTFNVKLAPNQINEFEFIYTPSKLDICYSYDKVVSRVNITHKNTAELSNIIYVSPEGKVSGLGTREDPMDLEAAIGVVKKGQTIVMLDGTYTPRETITISATNSGNKANKKVLKADEGANPVVDLQDKNAGFIISGNYWDFEGFTVMRSAGNNKPFHIGGDHNTVKNCTFHDNGDCGLQISRTDSSEAFEDWPTDNLVINCEAYNNCDPSKNNADGFAIKLTVGNGNVFEGCVSHHNLDDGWDLYTKLSTGAIGVVQVENCASYRQGFQLLEDGTDVDYRATSGGNGFKAGGESIAVMHYFKDCISFNNKGNGYDSNSNQNGKLRNVIFYNNQYSNVALYSSKRSEYAYDLKGVVSYRDDKAVITEATLADRVGTLTEFAHYSNGANDLKTETSNYFIWDTPTSPSESKQIAVSDINYKAQTYKVETLASEKLDADNFFQSLNETDSLTEQGGSRYPRNAETGAFEYGPFLARKVAYVHDPADAVTLPDNGSASTPDTPDTPSTPDATETTTTASRGNSGGSTGGGGGGGGGTSSRLAQTTSAATETETEKEEATEKTSSSVDDSTTTPVDNTNDSLFDDISSKPWAEEAVNALAGMGVINGTGYRTFTPDAKCKRADFVIMLVKLLGIEGTASDNFDDVDAGKYYANYVGLAKEAGIVNGYGDGNFGPENFCTREELMVMVANAISASGVDTSADESALDKFADADSIAAWAKPYVAFLAANSVVNGANGNINPKNDITRAEVAVIMYNVKNAFDFGAEEEAPVEVVEEVSEETSEETSEAAEGEAVEETTETVEETTETVEETTKAK